VLQQKKSQKGNWEWIITTEDIYLTTVRVTTKEIPKRELRSDEK
jgi:hypothetical protein